MFILFFVVLGIIAHAAKPDAPVAAGISTRTPAASDFTNRSIIKWRPFLTSLSNAAKISKVAVTLPFSAASHIVRKPIRDASFWGKALTIYGSYKVHQVKSKFRDSLTSKKDKNWKALQENRTEAMWNFIHEANSKRMVNLCLGMRGFYLKTGQFLGTRHDFMPRHYTSKLSKLHDDVPPISGVEVKKILENELGGNVEDFFSYIDLEKPIGSASVAQVHLATWRVTGEKVAVKVQYPNAERLMVGDLRNLRTLAEFLQKTEFKFDLLSSIKELQKQIINEFDFRMEARNMDFMRTSLRNTVPEVSIPRSIFASKRALVMTFVEGINLCKLSEFKSSSKKVPSIVKMKIGRNLLNVLAKSWGEMIFELNFFNADPHPGNVCLGRDKIGLLDWGQMKRLPEMTLLKFARMIEAINSKNKTDIIDSFFSLGIQVTDPSNLNFVEGIALTMMDTQIVPGFVIDPFSKNSSVGKNTVVAMPSDFYFVVRTIQLLRGLAYAFDLDFSVAKSWSPYARRTIIRLEKLQKQFIIAKHNR